MKKINESVSHTIVQQGWSGASHALNYHDHLVAMLNHRLVEGDEDAERTKVLKLMTAGTWDRSPEHFLASIAGSKHSKMLTAYSLDDYKKMDCFKVPGYNIGFALAEHDGSSGHKGKIEIVAVHNNSSIRSIGRELIAAAVKAGGKTLDHFDGFLSKLYADGGFEEYKRVAYDPSYDQDGSFANKYGKQPVIYRKYKEPNVQ